MIVIYHQSENENKNFFIRWNFQFIFFFRRRRSSLVEKSLKEGQQKRQKTGKRGEKFLSLRFCVFQSVSEAVAVDWSQLVVKCLSFHLKTLRFQYREVFLSQKALNNSCIFMFTTFKGQIYGKDQ